MRWPRLPDRLRLGRARAQEGTAQLRGVAPVEDPPRRRGSLRRSLVVWGVVGTVLAAALVFLFYFSAALVVKDIAVKGAKGDLADTVVELARIPHGRPLARVSEPGVQERVLVERRIADVQVNRSWPSSITFEVTLREPALALRNGKTFSLSDAGGVVYDTASKAPKGVPVVQVSAAPDQLTAETVKGLNELLAARPDAKALGGRLGTPVLAADGTVTMKVEQLEIAWGEPVDTEKKWAVVTALTAQPSIDPQGAVPQKIDVTVPDQPVVTGIPPAPQG